MREAFRPRTEMRQRLRHTVAQRLRMARSLGKHFESDFFESTKRIGR